MRHGAANCADPLHPTQPLPHHKRPGQLALTGPHVFTVIVRRYLMPSAPLALATI